MTTVPLVVLEYGSAHSLKSTAAVGTEDYATDPADLRKHVVQLLERDLLRRVGQPRLGQQVRLERRAQVVQHEQRNIPRLALEAFVDVQLRQDLRCAPPRPLDGPVPAQLSSAQALRRSHGAWKAV